MTQFHFNCEDKIFELLKKEAQEKKISMSKYLNLFLLGYFEKSLDAESISQIEKRLNRPMGRPPITPAASTPHFPEDRPPWEDEPTPTYTKTFQPFDDIWDPQWDGDPVVEAKRAESPREE